MVAIGCTGLIGSGKSAVCAQLARRGAVVLDADALSRAFTAIGGAAVPAVIERFGEQVVDGEGRLDRARLAEIIFHDDASRAELEAIVHPLVERAITDRLAIVRADRIAIVESPLLVETNGRERYELDAVLVVDCPEDLAIDRLVLERSMTIDEVRARIGAQVDRAERLQAADFVIVNMGTIDELAVMVDRAWEWMEGLQDEFISAQNL